MALKVAIQMDHIETVDIDADSTFVLALEAEGRGHALYHYPPDQLSFAGGRVLAQAQPLSVKRQKDGHYDLGPSETIDLGQLDVVLMRQDPPFDMAYITTTHLLEHIHPETLVVNDPAEVRNAPEKLCVTRFPDLMPPTLISSDHDRITAFRAEHKDIILKPLYGNGGFGVFHVTPGDENLNALLEMFSEIYREPIIAQKHLTEVRGGDRRIILIDGEAAGAVNRIPAKGEARANMHVGAEPVKCELSPRDREICAAIGPDLKARGLIFVGIDVIGGYLTEINVTSPTGIQEINRFDGVKLEAWIWDVIEARVK
ncbi:MAG: glutathione synthase [Rhodospirillaceae bacterium]|nr:glutathione synthase [Rhodospirillaceae bacterium]